MKPTAKHTVPSHGGADRAKSFEKNLANQEFLVKEHLKKALNE